jgi:hypothetical protein
LLFLGLALACGRRALPPGQTSQDGGPSLDAASDAGATEGGASETVPARGTASLDGGGDGTETRDGALGMDTTPGVDVRALDAAALDAAAPDAAPLFPCNLDCPAGPCSLRAGAGPGVIATGPKGERIASLAVASDALYFGTISPDIFARGRLSEVELATGQFSVLDPHVQASWIGLGPTSVFYVGDAVQARAGDLFILSRAGGTRRGWTTSDNGFVGITIVSDETVVYEQAYTVDRGVIWRFTQTASGGGGGVVVEVTGRPRGFALDATSVVFAAGTAPSTIQWAPADRFVQPSDIRLLLTSDDPVGHLVLAGPDVYFLHESEAGACRGSVAVVSKAGGTPRVVSLGRSGSDASSLAVDGDFVYWTTFDEGGRVFRAAKGGGIPEILATNQRSASNLVVDATRVYWIVEDANGDQVRALDKQDK